MKIAFDRYTHLDSPLHRCNPRYKLLGLMVLVFAFALVEDLQFVPIMLGITAILYGVSKLPLALLWKQLHYPGLFILAMVILLPFISGERILWQWGAIALRQEGCITAMLIVSRFLAIFTLGLILLETQPFLTTLKAMRSFGLPIVLADMMMLFYRYLYEIEETFVTMRRAMQLRGSQYHARSQRFLVPDFRHLQRMAFLAGTLLIRSYERSERTYKAMRLRGYGVQNSGLDIEAKY